MLLFSHYVPTESQKFDLGYVYLTVLALITVFNLIVAIKLFIREIKNELKRRKAIKYAAKRRRVRELKKKENVEKRKQYRKYLLEKLQETMNQQI